MTEQLNAPAIEEFVLEGYPDCEIVREIVPDEADEISAAFDRNLSSDFIITAGGTGLSLRDVTPETTEAYCTRRLPGIEETLRSESLKETKSAMLSRGFAGIRGSTVIVNFPGSVKAVTLCTRVVLPILDHAIRMIRGEGH